MSAVLKSMIIFTLVGCGDLTINGDPSVNVNTQAAKAVPAEAPAFKSAAKATTWTELQVSGTVASCTASGMERSKTWETQKPLTQVESDQYCACAYLAVQERWSYLEYWENEESILETLIADGSFQACLNTVITARGAK